MKESDCLSENLNYSQDKKKKAETYISFFNTFCELMGTEKQESEKIKALIKIEDIGWYTCDKMNGPVRLNKVFSSFESNLTDNESNNSNLLKGQILISATNILILVNAKDDYPSLFLNFVNFFLIDQIKKINVFSNIYYRQICCHCLEELETEYPGLLFSLMGVKTLELVNQNQNLMMYDVKSIVSSKVSMRTKSTDIPVYDKKIELENHGLYTLIEEENYYIFQYYLSLYSTLFSHMIAYVSHMETISKVEEVDDDDMSGEDSSRLGSVSRNSSSNNRLNRANNNSSTLNSQNLSSHLFLQNSSKSNKILHVNLNYSNEIENATGFNFDEDRNIHMVKVSPELNSYTEKWLFCIINLLPKISELVQTKVCKQLKFIISKIDVKSKSKALLPHFSYFHLNSNSAVLTLTVIKIVEIFKRELKENFILKLILKLCLLINDLRLNKALRILALRWLINFRFSNYNFNFNKYMGIFSYYLYPFPFDNVSVRIEKLKALFLFYDKITSTESYHIMQSVSIMDNYKYFPIFSNYLKSLFRGYFFIILRFPYKRFVMHLCGVLQENLKEVPRILPNMINLLRRIKQLKEMEKVSLNNLNFGTLIETKSDKQIVDRMTFNEIYSYLLIEFSCFLANFNSPGKLNRYFDLFIEIAKEDTIYPENLIIALRKVYNCVQENRDWKIEKSVLDVCKHLLYYHDLETMKKIRIDDLLNEIYQKSFDYGIRDQTKLYLKLVTNVEKPLMDSFLGEHNPDFTNLNIHYNIIDFGPSLTKFIKFEQSKKERLEAKIKDCGSAIFDKNFEQNILLLSDSFKNDDYHNQIYKKKIQNLNPIELYEMKDTNKITNQLITPFDILRLYIDDTVLDDLHDSAINSQKLFHYDNEFKFNNDEGLALKDINDINREKLLKDYSMMITENKFYIKLPMNLYLYRFNKYASDKYSFNSEYYSQFKNMKELYSIDLCFGKMDHLSIKGPILIPYLEQEDEDNIANPNAGANASVSANPNVNSSVSEDEQIKDFPYFYKIFLIAYPSYPIPSDVETRAIFYDSKGLCCTGNLNSIKFNFEDYFLPIYVPPQYNTIFTGEGKREILEVLFKNYWKSFKINQENKNMNYINSFKLLDIPKEDMINIVYSRLDPFLVNQNFLDLDYIVKNPYHEGENESNPYFRRNNCKVKNYYDKNTDKFKNNTYDFAIDEYLETSSGMLSGSIESKNKDSTYNLAKVLIFVPEKFHILFKIKISYTSTIVDIRSDCLKAIEYLDDYFDRWIDAYRNNQK